VKWKELGPLKISEVVNRSETPVNMKLDFEENPEDPSIVGQIEKSNGEV
jgi:hypothetical protein